MWCIIIIKELMVCIIYSSTCPVGKPIMDASGELVCTKPFPSMPSHFWNDPDGAKYKRAYFSKYPGMYGYMYENPIYSFNYSIPLRGQIKVLCCGISKIYPGI